MSDLISRADAIEAMWKALYAYEDLTEKQFMEHEELELKDWFLHRIFVQRMHEECMKAVEALPSAEPKTGRDCTDFVNWILEEVMDEEMWELNAVADGEVIARKLKKLGLLEVKDGYYIRPSAEAEDRHYIKIYADDEPSVKAEKLYQICGETQNREVTEWLKEYFPSAEPLVLSCDGCRHVGTYDTDFPCSGCIRREKDYYEQER